MWKRDLVTTESGDGVSKPADEITVPYPHVVIAPDPDPCRRDEQMAAVLEAIAEMRPSEEVWQVEYTRSTVSTRPEIVVDTIMCYIVGQDMSPWRDPASAPMDPTVGTKESNCAVSAESPAAGSMRRSK